MMARIGIRLALVVAIGATIACDRFTKHIAASTLAGTTGRSYLADTVRIEYAENTGGFLSLGAGLAPATRTALFTVATGLMLLVLVGVALRGRVHGMPLIGLGLFIAGGASNWADRLVRGSVVDFMNVGIGPLRTGIFNVADVALMVGAGLFVLGRLHRVSPASASGPGSGRAT